MGSKYSPPLIAALFSLGVMAHAHATQSTLPPVLQNLADAMVWTSLDQCAATYDEVLRRTQLATEAVDQDLAAGGHDKAYTRFVKRQVYRKLKSLKAEVTFLRGRCTAANYNPASLSLERESRLRQMLEEWRSTIVWASTTLSTASYPQPRRVNLAESLVPVPNPQPGQRFRDCAEAACQELVVIPPGRFIMGGTNEEARVEGVSPIVSPWERPQHPVTISAPFALSGTEVTLGAFRQFVRETG